MKPRARRRWHQPGLIAVATMLATAPAPTSAQLASPDSNSALGNTAVPLRGTRILNHDRLLRDLADPQWFKDNIPFLDVPDAVIQEIYYYRWSVFRRHLRYTNPATGYVVTQQLAPVGGQKFDTVSACAGHHIYEGRWLRNGRYLDDYELFWTQPDSGLRQWSSWLADACYARYLVNGDATFVTGLLSDLVLNYKAWADHFDKEVGLYWQTPTADAMGDSLAALADPVGGGSGYRPSLNAYLYGDARAIAKIAELAHDPKTVQEANAWAASLKAALQKQLWDKQRQLFMSGLRSNHQRLAGREAIGFIPWYFNLPDADYSPAWAQVMDPRGFFAPFGPTTLERRNPAFMARPTCGWSGLSFPYATSQTLTAMANLLNNYEQQQVTTDNYFTLLKNYASTQHRNNSAYVSMSHHPDNKDWVCDTPNFSEHTNHSTYCDLVISGLIGIRPRADETFEVNPLVPDTWDYFCLENVPYHGHLMTVLFDRDGTHYNKGAGLQIFVDSMHLAAAPHVQKLTANLPPPPLEDKPPRLDNFAVNVTGQGYPSVLASYTWQFDSAWRAIDGRIIFDVVPANRWTNYKSTTAGDWLDIDFGGTRTLTQVKLYLFADDVGVRVPVRYTLKYWSEGGWREPPNSTRTPQAPVANMTNTIVFDPVQTTKIRVNFVNAHESACGVTEIEAWGPAAP